MRMVCKNRKGFHAGLVILLSSDQPQAVLK